MSRFASTVFLAVCAGLGLAACGGGGATPDDPPPPPPPPPGPVTDYETIYSEAATTSVLRGTGLAIPESGQEANQIPLRSIVGSVRHDVGPLSLDDGQYAFTGTMYQVDPDDPEQGVYFSDGNGGVFFLSAFDGAGFDYVLRYNGEYLIGGQRQVAEGVAGIATVNADMPTGGTAHYNGVAIGSGATTSGGSFDLAAGNAAATVDFGAGTLSLIADGFDDTGAAVDEVRVNGAIINGATFGGGTVLLLNDGASAESILGGNVQAQVGGGFYGYDDTLDIPDELAGLLLKAGDDGYVALYFAAD